MAIEVNDAEEIIISALALETFPIKIGGNIQMSYTHQAIVDRRAILEMPATDISTYWV